MSYMPLALKHRSAEAAELREAVPIHATEEFAELQNGAHDPREHRQVRRKDYFN